MSLSVRVVRTKRELYELRDDWNKLINNSNCSSIFLTWEWIYSWIETVHPYADLFVIVILDKERHAVAIAPFYIANFTLFNVIRYKTLRYIGDCHSGMEYPDIIVHKDYESVALQSIASFLSKKMHLWDCAWFPNIALWDGALERISQCFKSDKLSFHRCRYSDFSRIVLPKSYDEYLQGFSGKQRRNLRVREKKLFKNANVTIEKCQHPEDVNKFLDSLFFLHRKRWEALGQPGAFVRRPLMVYFYRRMALRALEQDWLGLFMLSVNGQNIACQYGYAYKKTFSSLQEGFLPDAPSGCGNVLRLNVIRWCIENGLEEYDFLGGYSEHKQNWQAEKRKGCCLFLGKKSPKNIFLAFLPVWPSGKYINQGAPAL